MDDKKKLAEKIVTRQRKLEGSSERQNFERMAEEIAKYVIPRREIFGYDDPTMKGGPVGKNVYDPTAITAARTMADGMQGHLVSPRSKWFRRTTGIVDPALGELDDIHWMRDWLQQLERIEYRELAKSNFYQAQNEFFHDGVTIGTAVMYAEFDWNELRPVFLTRHPKEVYLSENSMGAVDTIFRKFKLAARVAVEKFDLDENAQRLAEDNPDELIEMIHAVYPRESRDVRKLISTQKKYASVYVHVGAKTGPTVVKESGYDIFPYAVWRYRKTPDGVYGQSPAWDMLETIKLLNVIQKAMITGTQLALDPPFAVPKEWKGKFRNVPGARNSYESDPKRIAYPMQGNGNIPYTSRMIDDLRNQVNEAYRVQFFMMLANSEKEMTATEIMERQGEKATLLGPAIGRLNAEALHPLMELLFDMLSKAGMLPEIPEQMSQYPSAELDADFVGPLAQAQEQYLGSQPIRNWLNMVVPFAEVFPDMLKVVRPTEIAFELARSAGMPASVMRSEEELEQIAKQEQQMQQMQMQMQAQQAQADTYKKTQKAPDEGSPAEALANPAEALRNPPR